MPLLGFKRLKNGKSKTSDADDGEADPPAGENSPERSTSSPTVPRLSRRLPPPRPPRPNPEELAATQLFLTQTLRPAERLRPVVAPIDTNRANDGVVQPSPVAVTNTPVAPPTPTTPQPAADRLIRRARSIPLDMALCSPLSPAQPTAPVSAYPDIHNTSRPVPSGESMPSPATASPQSSFSERFESGRTRSSKSTGRSGLPRYSDETRPPSYDEYQRRSRPSRASSSSSFGCVDGLRNADKEISLRRFLMDGDTDSDESDEGLYMKNHGFRMFSRLLHPVSPRNWI